MTERDLTILDDYWNALARGVSPAVRLDETTSGLLRQIHELHATPPPEEARARARQRVMQASMADSVDSTATLVPFPSRNGLSWPRPETVPHRQDLARRRPGVFALIAALVILFLGIGSYFAVVPREDRIFSKGGRGPNMIPAAQAPFDSGEIRLLWETSGTSEHRLWQPVAVAVAPDNTVYVANAFSSTIEVFSPEGDHLESWGEKGDGPGQFLFLSRGFALANLEFDAAGNLYVFDTLNHRIQKFAPDHAFIRQWGTHGTENPGEFDQPTGTVDDERGLVYVADRTGRVQVFDLDGNYQRQIGKAGSGPGELNSPWDVAVDAAGNIYIVDDVLHDRGGQSSTPRIQKFDPAGTFVEDIGAGSLVTKSGTAVVYLEVGPGDSLVLSAYGTDDIEIVSLDGKLLGSVSDAPLETPIDGPDGIAFDAAGDLYVTSENDNRLLKLDLPRLE